MTNPASNDSYVIVCGGGSTKKYWCKKGADYYWHPNKANARLYTAAKHARTALTIMDRHHHYKTLFPNWKVRVERWDRE